MAITFVSQRLVEHHAAASSWTTSSFTAGSTNNLLVLVLAMNSTGGQSDSLSSVTDNGTGSAWQTDFNLSGNIGINGLAVASTVIGSAGPTTLTITLAGSAATAYQILEFSGTATTSWLDVAGTAKAQAAGTAASTNTLTPAATGELIIGAFSVNSAQSSFTAGSGYTSAGNPTNTASPDVCAEYKLNGTTSETDGGTYAASVSTASRGVLVAYKAPAAAAPRRSIYVSKEAQRRAAAW